jgi:hypothetical protein
MRFSTCSFLVKPVWDGEENRLAPEWHSAAMSIGWQRNTRTAAARLDPATVSKNNPAGRGFDEDGETMIDSAAEDFAVPATGGRTFRLGDHAGRIVVLYFYPRDGTPGCTTEARQFRDLQYLARK